MQPWKVYVLTGKTHKQLCASVCSAFDARSEQFSGEVPFYPSQWFQPYLSRRRRVGWGLHTCPQAAWANYHTVIRNVLPLDVNEIVVCGMALGHADPLAIENHLVKERAPIEQSARFLD